MQRTHISPKFVSGTNTVSIPSGELWEVAIYSEGTHGRTSIDTANNSYSMYTTGQTDNQNFATQRHYYLSSNGNTTINPGRDNGHGIVTGWKIDLTNSNMSMVFEEISTGNTTDIPSNEVWHVAPYTTGASQSFNINNTSGTNFAECTQISNPDNSYDSPALYTFADGMQVEADNAPLVLMGFSETV